MARDERPATARRDVSAAPHRRDGRRRAPPTHPDRRPGEEIYRLPTQDQLVDEFGVSYPSVREAIRILETEGLVTVRRGNVGGLEAHRPDEGSAAYHLGSCCRAAGSRCGDLAAGLQMLEPMCAAECARRADRRRAVVPGARRNIERRRPTWSARGRVHPRRRGSSTTSSSPSPQRHRPLRRAQPGRAVVGAGGGVGRVAIPRGEYPSEAEAARGRADPRAHRRPRSRAGRAADAERVARAHLAATQALVLGRLRGRHRRRRRRPCTTAGSSGRL